MYICETCGELISDECYCAKDDALCSCGGTYKEAQRCIFCNEYFIKNIFNICDSCIQNEISLQGAIEYGEYLDKEEVKINSFIAFLFDENQIDCILKNAITELIKGGNYNKEKFEIIAKQFCLNDKYDFVNYLAQTI